MDSVWDQRGQPMLRRISTSASPNFSPSNCVRERPTQSEPVSPPLPKDLNELQKWDVLGYYDYQLGHFVNT
ncbi:hypothetical protein FEAC_03920 [Ferrimicrobium acidiphilum DSM 19497]|uniref:Uncharacterized protein n=1 Tax=Ferrimicrobium acidiphilum DSM 19497 TaxID=1121877 RepID=A0A0D8FXF0_9ACTN|nr:hypothetical protein FEAC_03920 [Ferrimicrobium acidiphilum DSM 19497]